MNKSKIVLSALMAGTLAVTSFAAGSLVSINVDPSIKILVNGNEFRPKDANGNDAMVFTYNGTTYAPLRALAEAYGLEVGYDAEKKMATVDSTSAIYDASGTVLYEDSVVKISYYQNYAYESWSGMVYGVQLIAENKTGVELTFSADQIALNGFSYSISCYDQISAYSTGYLYFDMEYDIPPRTQEVYRVNGNVKVYDSDGWDDYDYRVEFYGDIS